MQDEQIKTITFVFYMIVTTLILMFWGYISYNWLNTQDVYWETYFKYNIILILPSIIVLFLLMFMSAKPN